MAIVIYFSRAGENYFSGSRQYLEKGNTAVLAEEIARQLKVSAISIEPVTAYPSDYSATVELAEKEKNQGLLPAIKKLPDLSSEMEIFLGFPNWCGTFPMVVKNFLKSQSFNQKNIYPFCTHEGSAFGQSLEDLKKICPNANLKKGLAIRGSNVYKSETAIKNWLCQYQSDCGKKKCFKKGSNE